MGFDRLGFTPQDLTRLAVRSRRARPQTNRSTAVACSRYAHICAVSACGLLLSPRPQFGNRKMPTRGPRCCTTCASGARETMPPASQSSRDSSCKVPWAWHYVCVNIHRSIYRYVAKSIRQVTVPNQHEASKYLCTRNWQASLFLTVPQLTPASPVARPIRFRLGTPLRNTPTRRKVSRSSPSRTCIQHLNFASQVTVA